MAVAEPAIIVWSRGDVVGEIRDLSRQGMFIALARPGDVVGSRVVVRIGPSYPRASIAVAGVVRWRDDRGFGVELSNVGADEAYAIEMLMRVG